MVAIQIPDLWLAKLRRRSHAETTVKRYITGIHSFEQFLQSFKPKTIDLAYKAVLQDPYPHIDNYITWADQRGLKPMSIRTNLNAVISLLRFSGVQLNADKLKQIQKPKVIRIADEPLTTDTIVSILLANDPLVSAVILCLVTSGMRLGEALTLQVRDLHLAEKVPRITIRAENTKTKEQREIFITPQAATALNAMCASMHLVSATPADFVFVNRNGLPYTPTKFRERYNRVIKRAGLYKPIQGHKYNVLHPHIYRKYFFSVAVGIIGETAAHALMGHSFYLKTYFLKPLADKQADYQKLIPILTFNLSTTKALRYSPDSLLLGNCVKIGNLWALK